MSKNKISLSTKVAHNIIKNNRLKSKSEALGELAESPEEFLTLVRRYRREDDFPNPLPPVSRKVRFEKTEIGGRTLHFIRNRKKTRRIIFYLHGGAYIEGPNIIQWLNMMALASKTKSDIALLDYPKAPEAACNEILNVAENAYNHVLKEYPGMSLILMGDSAGGGLSLALFQVIKNRKLQLPEKILLLSPWLDVTMSHPEIPEYEESDLILSTKGLKACGKYYAGEQDPRDPLVSPKFGIFENIPETHIYVGGGELFKPDCREFAEGLIEKGEDVTLHYEESMQHTWPFFPVSREAKKARKTIYRILSE